MSTWDTIVDKKKIEQAAAIELFSSGVQGLLESQDIVLTLLGNQLSEHLPVTDESILKTTKKLDSLLDSNPAVYAFAFIKPDGTVAMATSNMYDGDLSSEDTFNFLENPVTKETFERTLNSDKVILGRTYFIAELDDLVIPVRKAIKDDSGNIIGVMSAGIRAKDSQLFQHDFSNSSQLIGIARSDGYWQYNSEYNSLNDKTLADEFFQRPIPSSYFKTVVDNLYDVYNVDPSTVKQNTQKYMFEHEGNKEHLQVALSYDPRFDHWYVSYVDWPQLQYQLTTTLFPYFVVFVSLHTVLFILFRYTSRTQQENEASLIKLANQDSLTGLPNRKYLRDNFDAWTQHHKRFSLLFVDLDHFKKINDSYGHEAGDIVLTELSERVRSVLSLFDILIREAGDEFIVVSPQTNQPYLEELAKKINSELSKPFNIFGSDVVLGCSIGVSVYPDHGNNLIELLKSADRAMYLAKKTRNSYRFFNESLRGESQFKFRVEQKLRQALEHNDLKIKYQPQVNAELCLSGVEALLRWHDHELGVVSPSLFITIAEKAGMMPEVSRYLFNQLITEISQFNPCLKQASLSVNISVSHFMMDCFVSDVVPLINKCKESDVELVLEITETLLINDIVQAKQRVVELKSLGVKISLDDFGTGYSSLSMLKDLPMDEIKIDRSFIQNVESDHNAYKMVKNIVAIGKNLDKLIVAEGIENASHWRLLTQCGCDLFQGNFVAKPLALPEINEFSIRHQTPSQAKEVQLSDA
ncbi:bifunctional diguanylate cyclase/phosphodiesterase [Vibrio ulleungensis]|uniref:EAL domain-containing protein n=1 Tax=Vibrio ulleungensis TaxID=2807619 RepID=A0ABS2HF91_9VIBR|nr:EAL domain-containing protein [Vibrio ulleungensis]MBM7035739.1 EAL domain-containing protein [Vibrio ulleungensis]